MQLELSGIDLWAHVNDFFSLVNQRPDLGPAVHCESSRTGHDCRSPGSGIDGFCFAASRRVSLLFRDGYLNKESFCASFHLFSDSLFWELCCSFCPKKIRVKNLIWFFGLEELVMQSLGLHLCILLVLKSPNATWWQMIQINKNFGRSLRTFMLLFC